MNQKIKNDIFWKNMQGEPIYSQGGGVFKFNVGGKEQYYWYGVRYKEAKEYMADSSFFRKTNTFESVTCYSSTDLVNWFFEGDVLTREQISGTMEMEGENVQWAGRLGVAYVEGIYAMFIQHEYYDPDDLIDREGGDMESDGITKQVLVLTADSPTGVFTWNQRINMARYTGGTSNTGDQTVFTDEDTGESYLIYCCGRVRGKNFISKIEKQKDGKIGLGRSFCVYSGDGREGNCMFKYKGKYYLCATDLYGWDASHVYYLVLDSLEEKYLENLPISNRMEVMPGCSDDFCHVTQAGFFYTLKGTEKETVIFCGDRWSDFAGNGLGYNQWCPLSFSQKGTPYFHSLNSWEFNAVTGEWHVAEDNDYVKNGSFEADRMEQAEIRGWMSTVSAGHSPVMSDAENKVTGKFGLTLREDEEFSCRVFQRIVSTEYAVLPDGQYDLAAEVKVRGKFDLLKMYAKSGKWEKETDLTWNESNEWMHVILENVKVVDHRVEIGFEAAGQAGASCSIDDVTFVSSQQGHGEILL